VKNKPQLLHLGIISLHALLLTCILP